MDKHGIISWIAPTFAAGFFAGGVWEELLWRGLTFHVVVGIAWFAAIVVVLMTKWRKLQGTAERR